MAKPEREFVHYLEFEERPVGDIAGITERIIAKDPTNGMVTRILSYEPGTDTSPNGVQAHDYWEEIYIMEGSMIDLTLNQEFTQGMVACRPPGMKHGPWISPNGCKLFEVRYYSK